MSINFCCQVKQIREKEKNIQNHYCQHLRAANDASDDDADLLATMYDQLHTFYGILK